jgi:hypothetical protein
MVMPIGKKFDLGYAKASLGYKEIADCMTHEFGDKMNHSTARGVFLNAMKKIAKEISKVVDGKKSFDYETISRDPRFQSAIEAYLKGEI